MHLCRLHLCFIPLIDFLSSMLKVERGTKRPISELPLHYNEKMSFVVLILLKLMLLDAKFFLWLWASWNRDSCSTELENYALIDICADGLSMISLFGAWNVEQFVGLACRSGMLKPEYAWIEIWLCMPVTVVVTAVTNDWINEACSFAKDERNTLEVNGSSRCSELKRPLASQHGECMSENDVSSAHSSIRRHFIIVSTFSDST